MSTKPTRPDGKPTPDAWDPASFAHWLIQPGVDGGEELCYGLRKRRLPNIGIPLYQLHHSAHPDKRSREWREREQRRTIPAQIFAREYDLAFEAPLGKPVFARVFAPNQHVVDTIDYDPTLALIAGFDFGLNPSAVLLQLPRNGDVNVFAEILIETPMALAEYLEDVFWPWIADECPVRPRPILAVCDPSGENRDQASGDSPVNFLRRAGLPPILGPKEFPTRQNLVIQALQSMNGDHARLRISAARCPLLIAGFKGGYRFPQQADTKKARPVKDKFSHVQDAFQYALFRAKLIRGGAGLEAIQAQHERPRGNWRASSPIPTQAQASRDRGAWRAFEGSGLGGAGDRGRQRSSGR